ncbi:MAG TPA: hypothetical protein VHU23_11355 [Rhizomicrobium sp.]|jgi:hypothetical protein|nr:hypothetical protein [Rhizomicrobium sp.]
MPKGPRGEKRPADVIGCAVMIGRIATGEIPDNPKSNRINSGRAGAAARSSNLTSEQRRTIAQKAAGSRWGKEE